MNPLHTAYVGLVWITYAGRMYGPVTSVASYSESIILSQFVTTAENMDIHLIEATRVQSTECTRRRLYLT